MISKSSLTAVFRASRGHAFSSGQQVPNLGPGIRCKQLRVSMATRVASERCWPDSSLAVISAGGRALYALLTLLLPTQLTHRHTASSVPGHLASAKAVVDDLSSGYGCLRCSVGPSEFDWKAVAQQLTASDLACFSLNQPPAPKAFCSCAGVPPDMTRLGTWVQPHPCWCSRDSEGVGADEMTRRLASKPGRSHAHLCA